MGSAQSDTCLVWCQIGQIISMPGLLRGVVVLHEEGEMRCQTKWSGLIRYLISTWLVRPKTNQLSLMLYWARLVSN